MKNSNWIEVDSTNWSHSDRYADLFDDLKFAIVNKRFISFEYYSNKHEFTKRKIKPVRLVLKAWSWYLYGFCALRNDFRFFKLSRIKNHCVHDDTYQEDYSNLFIEKVYTVQKMVHVKLKFNKRQVSRVYDDFYDDIIETEDGLFLEIDLPEDYLYTYILSFGSSVEVLEPKVIRTKIKSILKNTINIYRT